MFADNLLTVHEVQVVTGLGRTTIYQLIRTGELPVVRIGRSVRVRLETLKRFIADHEDDPSPPLPLQISYRIHRSTKGSGDGRTSSYSIRRRRGR